MKKNNSNSQLIDSITTHTGTNIIEKIITIKLKDGSKTSYQFVKGLDETNKDFNPVKFINKPITSLPSFLKKYE